MIVFNGSWSPWYYQMQIFQFMLLVIGTILIETGIVVLYVQHCEAKAKKINSYKLAFVVLIANILTALLGFIIWNGG